MVRYDITPDQLNAEIDAARATWRAMAKDKTKAIRARGHYDKDVDGQGWGDIKSVYMKLQANKCAYCERKLAGPPYGNREHDVEHFRPKSRLRAWPNAKMHRHLVDRSTGKLKAYPFPLGSAHEDQGYHLIAFHPLNYCTACARCNQSLKSDFFPVRGARQLKQGDPTKFKSEKPFLIYPIGSFSGDPETLITFAGVLPVPVAASGFDHERAEVTIDFFALDSEDLAEERARILTLLYLALEVMARGPADPLHADSAKAVERATSHTAPHSACARAFVHVFHADPALARRYFEEADAVVARVDGTV